MNNKNFWAAMQELSAPLFKTYAAIHKLSDNEVGYCFATNESISIKLNKHEKSISRDISDLIELGYLFSNVIKSGFKVVERRLYTSENLKTFIEDQKNIKNLIKTKIEIIDEISYYYNEKNSNVTGNKSVTGKVASNKIEDCTGNNFEDGAGNKIVTVTNTNITNTKTTTIEEKKIESSSSSLDYRFLDKYLDLATKINFIQANPNITESEFIELYAKCQLEVKQGFARNLNAILIKASKGLWNFQAKEESKTITPKSKIEKIIQNKYSECVDYYNSFSAYTTPKEIIEKFKTFCSQYDLAIVEPYIKKMEGRSWVI